jgi:hypothetical protein
MQPGVIHALAQYIRVLTDSAGRTSKAEDRMAYTKHLAEAAIMFSLAHAGDAHQLADKVAQERHTFGWGYLSGPEGEAAEAAFQQFAALAGEN